MRPDDSGFADLLNGLTLGSGRHRRAEPSPASPTPAESPAPEPAIDETPAEIVRAYAWTAGRTRADAQLELETLVSVAQVPAHPPLPAEHHAIVEICDSTRSVAEVAALLGLPLGVAKVLVGDLASRGVLVVHRTSPAPDLTLMERVLSGLRNL